MIPYVMLQLNHFLLTLTFYVYEYLCTFYSCVTASPQQMTGTINNDE